MRVVLDELYDYTSIPVASLEQARDTARELLATMWRRPGATLSILDDDKQVLWSWTGWRVTDPERLTFNQWVQTQHLQHLEAA